jgi:DNA mismatch endonuclease (patch repair protein)
MVDVFNKEKRSLVMAKIRGEKNRDTELKLIRMFRAAGVHGWRRKYKIIGKPDFVFVASKTAVFVDGCFWHACPVHGRVPGSNSPYWSAKLVRNRARDKFVKRSLLKRGWTVLRVWEHELAQPSKVIRKILKSIT